MIASLPLLHAPASVFFLNDTPTAEIYTLSLHDALPILECASCSCRDDEKTSRHVRVGRVRAEMRAARIPRSEEHTSELQSHSDLVCRLLLEKKNIPESE